MIQFILLMLSWILVGWACAVLAEKKGRDPIIWFYLGVFFSLIAIVILYFLPAGKPKVIKREAVTLPPPTQAKEPWFYLDKDTADKLNALTGNALETNR